MAVPSPERPGAWHPAGSRPAVWIVGVLAALALVLVSVVSIGLAAVEWVPLVLLVGVAMLSVWVARRHRQAEEGRNAGELRDASHADAPWPTRGITDDRLPDVRSDTRPHEHEDEHEDEDEAPRAS